MTLSFPFPRFPLLLILCRSIVVSLAETLDSHSFLKGIRQQAQTSSIWVSVGIHELPSKSDDSANKRCYNTQCLVSSDGSLAGIYRKLHLFDVDIKGGLQISESNTTLKGMELPQVHQTPAGRLGMLTCYDLRFPEPSLILRQQGADIISYPSAFTVKTGMAHWGEHRILVLLPATLSTFTKIPCCELELSKRNRTCVQLPKLAPIRLQRDQAMGQLASSIHGARLSLGAMTMFSITKSTRTRIAGRFALQSKCGQDQSRIKLMWRSPASTWSMLSGFERKCRCGSSGERTFTQHYRRASRIVSQ